MHRRTLLLSLLAAAATPALAAEPKLETVVEWVDRSWSLAFLPDGRMLVTERSGALRVVTPDGRLSTPVAGLPQVSAVGQGGLLDVVLHPALRRRGWSSCPSPSRARAAMAPA